MALHPEVKKMLDVLYASGWVDPSELTPQAAREQSERYAKLRQFPGSIPDVKTTDHQIPVDSQQKILARCYYLENEAPAATILFYHGGGYVLSDISQYDTVCRWICSVLEMPIVAIEYRLAPEYPFPTPIEDGYQALCWVATNAQKLALKNDKFIVMGDSAGAHLAAMVSLLARDRSGPRISWQWLIYPWVDNDASRPSYDKFFTGYGLTTPAMKWFDNLYLRGHHDPGYPAYPLQFTDFTHLPHSYVVVAENDVLHDEGKLYAEKLRSGDNTVYIDTAEGMIHGFINHYSIPAGFNAALTMFKKMKRLIVTSVS